MRFIQFVCDDKRCIGVEVEENGDIINLNSADGVFPSNMLSFIEQNDGLKGAVERYCFIFSPPYRPMHSRTMYIKSTRAVICNLSVSPCLS